LRFADVIIIATKPDVIKPCLTQLVKKSNPQDFETKSFISIAAGVPISALESYLPQQTKSMIRVMPNTPCLVGQSATVFAPGTKTTEEDKEICAAMFRSVGTVTEVQEKIMDAATGLSGSGPACEFLSNASSDLFLILTPLADVYTFIEALADGGVRAGLSRKVAMQLAAQTVKGAAMMCIESGLHPGALKDQVCSAGGTTIAAVQTLEEHGFRAATMAAVVSAATRSAELREESKS
jgi:pyrroline-5-carboxylate reductase